MNWAEKSLIFVILCTICFKIEFFPLSNYQMYSQTFLPEETYKYLKITALNHEDEEIPFRNSQYKIFQAEFLLVASIRQKLRTSSIGSTKILNALLKKTRRQDPNIKKLRLYQMQFDWSEYKRNSLFNNEPALKPKHSVLLNETTI